MIKDLDYKGIRKDVCDEIGVTIKDFKASKDYKVTASSWARAIAYAIVTSYGLTSTEACKVLEISYRYADNMERIFINLSSESEDFRQTYAILKMSCYRKYRKDIHIKNS